MDLHQLLLFSWPRLAGGQRLLKYWRRMRSNGGPFVELLAEKISFEAQKNLCTLDLSKIEALRGNLFRVGHYRIDIRPYEVSKCFCGSNDFLQYFLLFRLKGQVRDLSLPILKVFKFGASSIARDLDAIIAYRASVIVILFDLATSNFQALAVVPVANSANIQLIGDDNPHHS